MAKKKTQDGLIPSARTRIYKRKCIVFELKGDLSSIPIVLEEIRNGNPPKDTDPLSPGLGIKNEHQTHSGWFFSTGIKGQDNVLPHTTSSRNPTQSTPLHLSDEQFLATPVAFALNHEKKLLIVVSSTGGITPQQIIKLLSKNKAHAERKESKKLPISRLLGLAEKAKKASFKYVPNDRIAYLRETGLSGIGQEADVSSLVVSWKLTKQSKKDYADMRKEVQEAEQQIRSDLSGIYQECKLTAINSDGEEETVDLFDHFMSYSGNISATGRDISFLKFVDFLQASIRSMPL